MTTMTRMLIATLATAPAAWAQIATPVTYTKDIAPLVNRHCLECHRPGMGTPFNFLTYDDVKKRARLIEEVTGNGFMPPWKAERGHTALRDERGLSPDEIATIAAWVAQGRNEGNPADLPVPPVFPEGWRLGIPDIILEMPEAYPVPADGPDIYHNFVMQIPELPEGTWVKGIEFQPSAPSVVHHSLFDLDRSGVALRMDAMDAGPGFGGMEQRFADERIGGYAVGALPTWLPEGVAIAIPDDALMVIETHFHPSGKAESEKSRMGLFLTKEPPTRELVALPIPAMFGMTTGLEVPAGEANFVVEHSYTVPCDVEAIKINPHAHYICKEIEAVAKFPDNREQVLIRVLDWDFAWQEQYIFEEPVLLPRGTEIQLRFVYDNSAANPRNPFQPPQRIGWGPQSTDEMAGCGLSVIAVRPEDTPLIRQAINDYRIREFETVDVEILRPILIAEMNKRFDKDGDGTIGWREQLGMIQYWRATQADAPDTPAMQVQQVMVRRVFGDYIEQRRQYLLWGTAVVMAVAGATITLIARRWKRRHSGTATRPA